MTMTICGLSVYLGNNKGGLTLVPDRIEKNHRIYFSQCGCMVLVQWPGLQSETAVLGSATSALESRFSLVDPSIPPRGVKRSF